MRRAVPFAVVVATLLAVAPFLASADGPTQSSIAVFFSPRGGCTDAIVRELESAKKTVRIQAYSFTSKPIAEAIVAAIKRGVKVEALLDKSNQSDRYSSATFLKNEGATVLIDSSHQIAHNKIIIIDDAVLITGSFNFSKAAEESNAENLLAMKGYPDLVKKYIGNYDEHKQHSKPYEPAKAPEGEPEKRQPRKK